MAKLLPFPSQRIRQTAACMLKLVASPEKLKKPRPWANRPDPPEALGNLLQRLVVLQPEAILLIENLVAEMIAQIES